jgi:hypothetical protein
MLQKKEEELFKLWSVNFKRYLYSEYEKGDPRLANCDLTGRDIVKTLDRYGELIIKSFNKLAKKEELTKEEAEIFTELKLFAVRSLEALNSGSDISILDKSYDIGLKKNHDYGSANITNFGVLGVLVRLNDKVQRVRNLLLGMGAFNITTNLNSTNKMKVSDEKVEDTLMDMINYATYGNMLLDGIWFNE